MRELDLFLPAWIDALEYSHPIKSDIFSAIKNGTQNIRKIRDAEEAVLALAGSEHISTAAITGISLGTGVVKAAIELPKELFYQTLSERSGFAVADDGDLMTLLTELAGIKTEYDKVKDALRDVRETGYGIVSPSIDELTLEEPEIVKQGGRYGVRLKASAPSIHIERNKQKYRSGQQTEQTHLSCRCLYYAIRENTNAAGYSPAAFFYMPEGRLTFTWRLDFREKLRRME